MSVPRQSTSKREPSGSHVPGSPTTLSGPSLSYPLQNTTRTHALSARSPYARAGPKPNERPTADAGPNTPCKFWQTGSCRKGTSCRYRHIRIDETGNVESTSSAGIKAERSDVQNTSERIPSQGAEMLEQGATSMVNVDDWVNAAEFIPKSSKQNTKSYAQVVSPVASASEGATASGPVDKLCPYAASGGVCKYPKNECSYTHGEICELCGNAALHPINMEQRKKHVNDCIRQHELDMELSFAVARSREKSCGICFELIMDKTPREQRFGILPNCNHCFCLACIRKWRQAKQFDNKIIRACPECRTSSDFVCPSMYWVDTKEEKDKLITDYKEALSLKACKYFKQGHGKCPFGNKCFYLHALADGTKTDVGPPQRQHRRHNHSEELDVLQQIILWDFLEERENRWLYSIDDLEDLVAFFSDSEDSDWSDYDFFFD